MRPAVKAVHTHARTNTNTHIPDAGHASGLRTELASLQLTGNNLSFRLQLPGQTFKLQLLGMRKHTMVTFIITPSDLPVWHLFWMHTRMKFTDQCICRFHTGGTMFLSDDKKSVLWFPLRYLHQICTMRSCRMFLPLIALNPLLQPSCRWLAETRFVMFWCLGPPPHVAPRDQAQCMHREGS